LHTLEKYFPECETEYIRNKYSRPADDLARIELIKTRLSGRADAITPGQIENLLDALTKRKDGVVRLRETTTTILFLSPTGWASCTAR
jgi:hypothetical protein